MLDKGIKLVDDLDTVSTTCCATAVRPVLSDDSSALFEAFGTLVPKIEGLSGALSSKSSIAKAEYPNSGIKMVINVLSASVGEIKKCLIDRAPSNQTDLATNYDSRIIAAFKTATAAYPEVVSETKPANPVPEGISGSNPPQQSPL